MCSTLSCQHMLLRATPEAVGERALLLGRGTVVARAILLVEAATKLERSHGALEFRRGSRVPSSSHPISCCAALALAAGPRGQAPSKDHTRRVHWGTFFVHKIIEQAQAAPRSHRHIAVSPHTTPSLLRTRLRGAGRQSLHVQTTVFAKSFGSEIISSARRAGIYGLL